MAHTARLDADADLTLTRFRHVALDTFERAGPRHLHCLHLCHRHFLLVDTRTIAKCSFSIVRLDQENMTFAT
jgi:hypothetical protein